MVCDWDFFFYEKWMRLQLDIPQKEHKITFQMLCEIWRIEQASRTHKVDMDIGKDVICIVLDKSNSRIFNDGTTKARLLYNMLIQRKI